jgi:RNA polymerase sigma factor (sigma-70 family)
MDLTKKSDLQLIEMVKAHASNEATKEICRRYENIFYKVCNKYTVYLTRSGINIQDIFDEKNFIIHNCVTSFDPSKKTKLGTWIGNYARYLCLNSIHSRRFTLSATNEDVNEQIEKAQARLGFFQHTTSVGEDFEYALNILKQLSDKRIFKVFVLRYLHKKKLIWTEISKRLGVSTQTAINLHSRGIEILRHKMSSKNIMDKI